MNKTITEYRPIDKNLTRNKTKAKQAITKYTYSQLHYIHSL